jgi:VIT1/CCC1 family predicted Fe2+/Mn2+ transporter
LREFRAPPATVRLEAQDWLGAGAVALLVFLCTFPVVVPFLFVRETAAAMRLSNAVAVAMLAMTGAAYGRQVGRSAWGFGLLMVVLGGLLVALTIALGG